MTTRDSILDRRYGEVLLIRMSEHGPRATVYNSFPLNDCPPELWNKLDAQAIASENDAVAAILNGPRHWLMSRIEKDGGTEQERRTFGGIEMLKQATVVLSSMNPAPYSVNEVDRKAVFIYDAGVQVFELTSPDGRRWVMQTYSQTVNPNLTLEQLPDLDPALPQGWSYSTRTLEHEMRIDTSTTRAQVLQDDQANSYSLLA